MQPENVFTVGQISRICHVASRTVAVWTDSGRLPCYRLPGSRDRRVTESNLRRFLEAAGMPTDALDATVCRDVLLATSDLHLPNLLVPELAGKGVSLTHADCYFRLAVHLCNRKWLGVCVDLSLGRGEGLVALAHAATVGGARQNRVALVGADESAADVVLAAGAASVMLLPADAGRLAELLLFAPIRPVSLGRMRVRDVCDRTGLLKADLLQMYKVGSFPQPTRLSNGVLLWEPEEVERWVANGKGVAL